jgi:hypothetical protein
MGVDFVVWKAAFFACLHLEREDTSFRKPPNGRKSLPAEANGALHAYADGVQWHNLNASLGWNPGDRRRLNERPRASYGAANAATSAWPS